MQTQWQWSAGGCGASSTTHTWSNCGKLQNYYLQVHRWLFPHVCSHLALTVCLTTFALTVSRMLPGGCRWREVNKNYGCLEFVKETPTRAAQATKNKWASPIHHQAALESLSQKTHTTSSRMLASFGRNAITSLIYTLIIYTLILHSQLRLCKLEILCLYEAGHSLKYFLAGSFSFRKDEWMNGWMLFILFLTA